MFVYVLLKFDWLINLFYRQSAKKIEDSQVFFSIIFVQFLKCHDCACSALKSGIIFSSRAEILTEWKTTLCYKGAMYRIWGLQLVPNFGAQLAAGVVLVSL